MNLFSKIIRLQKYAPHPSKNLCPQKNMQSAWHTLLGFCLGLLLLSLPQEALASFEDSTRVGSTKQHPKPALQKSYEIGAKRLFDFDNGSEAHNLIPLDTGDITGLRAPTQTALKYIRKARASLKTVKDSKLFTALFNPQEQIKLPIAIQKIVGNTEYNVVIDSIVVMPAYSYIVAYMIIENQEDSSKLYFIGKQIKISKAGGLINAKMELAADYPMTLAGGKAQAIFKAESSYVEFDCDGFKSLSIDAAVIFSRDWLVVEEPNGTINEQTRVVGEFKANIQGWDDLVVAINFRQPFQLRELPGFGFTVRQAVFDFSDTNSPPGMSFPANYLEDSEESLALWRGFYLREAELRLPPSFKSRQQQNVRKVINISDVIIDHNGISATVKALNLLDLEEGDMGRWQFSLDSLGFRVEKNQLITAGFRGKVIVPISKQEQSLSYSALIRPRDNAYEFLVSNDRTLSFPVLQAAEVELHPTSFLEVKVINGKFLPRACLTGKMSIESSLSSAQKVSFPSIRFRELEVLSIAPYLKVKDFSFDGGGQSPFMAGFPVSIQNLALKTYSDGTALEFELLLNLMGDAGFAASAGLRIIGDMDEGQSALSWRFKKVEVSRIALDVNQGAFKLKGSLDFFREDPVYGTGFQGLLNMEINKPGNDQNNADKLVKVSATALFGATPEKMRYWYADANVIFQPAIPFLGPVELSGFSGALYYRMQQSPQGAQMGANQIGVTQTGIRYVPDSKVNLGVRAGINFQTTAAQAFNGDATFEMVFNKNGGVQRVFFSGNAYFMTKPVEVSVVDMKQVAQQTAAQAETLDQASGKKEGSTLNKGALENASKNTRGEAAAKPNAQMSAHVHIDLNIEAGTLDGNFRVMVNAAGGTLRGTGPNNTAGEAVLHISPQKWYIRVGTPQQKIGLELVSIARINSYLMIGDELPGSPPPPPQVQSILGGQDLDYMRDLNALGLGSGFALGADLSVDTGDLNFLIFYARFMAGAGFDIMVKNYGTNLRCEGSSDPIGINGWYANGQVYAYLQGDIGVQVRLRFIRGRFKILSIGAAAVLQAKLPRPTWMKGVVGGRYSILGGLVSGSCRFEMTLGRECTLVGTPPSPLADVQLISDITPKDTEVDVDVFSNPQAIFNMEIGKNLNLTDTEGRTRVFRSKLDKAELSQVSGGKILGTLEWNEDRTVLAYSPRDILPPKQKIKFEVQVSFEEQRNGVWQTVIEEGKKVIESRIATFMTGEAPDYIPESNILYSYPVIAQLHYYKDETPEGFIKLKKGQPYLFEASEEWLQEGKLQPLREGEVAYFGVGYEASKQEVFFEIPRVMQNNQIYRFELVRVPKKGRADVDSNVGEKLEDISGDGSAQVRNKQAEGNLVQLTEESFYKMHFKTSRYASFKEKMNALQPLSSGAVWPVATGIHELSLSWRGEEFFDKAELLHSSNAQSLIAVEANPFDAWMNNFIRPLNYEGYPVAGIRINQWRREDLYGVPPLRDVRIQVGDDTRALTAQHIELGQVPQGPAYGSLVYYLAISTFQDNFELRNKAAAMVQTQGNHPWIRYILQNEWVSLQRGSYTVKVSYRLPNGRVTSEWQTNIQRP